MFWVIVGGIQRAKNGSNPLSLFTTLFTMFNDLSHYFISIVFYSVIVGFLYLFSVR